MRRMMVVTAHPDDEASSFGGSLRLYQERGVETCIICLTPGQAATHRGSARTDQELGELRRKEFAAACEILKVSRGIVLDYPDGQLHRHDLYKVVCDLTLHIRRFRPQVLLTFGPEGSVTGHTDHATALRERSRGNTQNQNTNRHHRASGTNPEHTAEATHTALIGDTPRPDA